MSTWGPAALEALIEEATVDAYGEDEQRTGFFTEGWQWIEAYRYWAR